jgi:hypothetical protein
MKGEIHLSDNVKRELQEGKERWYMNVYLKREGKYKAIMDFITQPLD